MRFAFAEYILADLCKKGALTQNASVLAVCADRSEWQLFTKLGFSRVTITGMNPQLMDGAMAPFDSKLANVQELPFKRGEFDWVFVSDGLHHCDSPHGALLEMYRVAARGVIVIESRDSWVQRLAENIMWPRQTYELAAVEGNGGTCGGVNYTCVPNYVYRWTEREFEKTISCADPTGRPLFRYFYGFNPPKRKFTGVKLYAYKATVCVISLVARVFKKQSNSFCMVALKPTALFPWLVREGEQIKFKG